MGSKIKSQPREEPADHYALDAWFTDGGSSEKRVAVHVVELQGNLNDVPIILTKKQAAHKLQKVKRTL